MRSLWVVLLILTAYVVALAAISFRRTAVLSDLGQLRQRLPGLSLPSRWCH